MIYPDISVGTGLVPARVSGYQFGVIATGGHKILPYANPGIRVNYPEEKSYF